MNRKKGKEEMEKENESIHQYVEEGKQDVRGGSCYIEQEIGHARGEDNYVRGEDSHVRGEDNYVEGGGGLPVAVPHIEDKPHEENDNFKTKNTDMEEGGINDTDEINQTKKEDLIIQKINEQMYYEAHHMLKTIINRKIQKKEISKCIKMLLFYSEEFAKAEEYVFMCDLMIQCLNILINYKISFTEKYAQKIITVFKMIPQKATDEKYRFMNKAVIWSQTEKEQIGCLCFHEALGYAYFDENKYELAHNHFVYLHDSSVLYKTLCAWRKEGYPSEIDFFVLRSVFCLILLMKFQVALNLIYMFEENLDRKDVSLPIQIAYLITNACMYNSVELYENVKYRYRLILQFDPDFQKYIKEIDTTIFKKGKNGIFNLLQNMFK